MLSPIVFWLADSDLSGIETSSYWNDREQEKGKVWEVEAETDTKALRYLKDETNLEEAFLAGIALLENRLGHELRGVCVDLGAGSGWASAILAKKSPIERVYAVDFSRHRLERLAPLILRQYGAPPEKVIRVVGNFYDIKLPDASVDLVVMAQTFHHVADAHKLLRELKRILVPGGSVIVTGEKPITIKQYVKRLIFYNVKGLLSYFRIIGLASLILKREITHSNPLFGVKLDTIAPPDPIKGDKNYLITQVKKIFHKTGYDLYCQEIQTDTTKQQKSSVNYIAISH